MFRIWKLIFASMFILLLPLQTQTRAAEPPGADLLDVAYKKQFGLAVLSRFDLFLTRDGSAWTEAGFRGEDQGLSALALSDGLIYLGTETGGILRGEKVSELTPLTSPRDPFNRPILPVRFLAADSQGKRLMASSGQGVVLSGDGGLSWNPVREPFYNDASQREVVALGFVKGDPVVITRRGVHKGTGKGFEPFVNGLPEKITISAAAFDEGRALVALAGQGMFEATGTRSWKKIPAASEDPLVFVGYRNGGYFASRPFSRLKSLNEKGGQWLDVGPFSPDFTALASVPTPFGSYVVLKGKGLTLLQGGGLKVVDLPRALSSVYARTTLGDITLAGTQAGVFLSSNGGRTWTDVTPSDLGKPVNVILPLSDGRILLGSDGVGVWMSQDGGKSWGDWSLGLGTSNTISQILEIGGRILAATENGLMVTPVEAQAAWKRLDPGVGLKPVRSLVRDGDQLWAATVEGVYRAGPDLKFATVKGLEKTNGWLDAQDGRVVVLSQGRVFLFGKDGRVRSLAPLPGSALPAAVALYKGSVHAGTNRGTYRWSEESWAYAGGPALPVQALVEVEGRLHIIIAGGGTFALN